MNFKLLLTFAFALSMYERVDAKPSLNEKNRDLTELGMSVLHELGLTVKNVLDAYELFFPFTEDQIVDFLEKHDVLAEVNGFITKNELDAWAPEDIVAAACSPGNAEIVEDVLGWVKKMADEAEIDLPALPNICPSNRSTDLAELAREALAALGGDFDVDDSLIQEVEDLINDYGLMDYSADDIADDICSALGDQPFAAGLCT